MTNYFYPITKMTKGNNMTKVLLVSNDSSLRKFINLTLKFNGCSVLSATDSTAAWTFLKEIRFDLIIVDYQLNQESGLAFYKSLRQFGATLPVLMIGEGAFDEFMLKDLSPTNYDYLLKPFKFRELKMKINSLMQAAKIEDDFLTFGDLRIDVRQQLIILKDQILQVGKIEMRLLVLLAKRTGDIVDPKRIKKLLEAEGNYFQMTPFYYVSNLRHKLKQIAGDALEITLIKNEGYRLDFKGEY
jgi:DNA-binding response OmpR family regulator